MTWLYVLAPFIAFAILVGGYHLGYDARKLDDERHARRLEKLRGSSKELKEVWIVLGADDLSHAALLGQHDLMVFITQNDALKYFASKLPQEPYRLRIAKAKVVGEDEARLLIQTNAKQGA